jgi:hypothetical protein
MNPGQQAEEGLKELRAVLTAQKAEIETLGRAAAALGLPADAPPTLEQIEAAASPEVAAAVRGAAAEAELADLTAPAGPKIKMPRKVRDTI